MRFVSQKENWMSLNVLFEVLLSSGHAYYFARRPSNMDKLFSVTAIEFHCQHVETYNQLLSEFPCWAPAEQALCWDTRLQCSSLHCRSLSFNLQKHTHMWFFVSCTYILLFLPITLVFHNFKGRLGEIVLGEANVGYLKMINAVWKQNRSMIARWPR